MADDSIIDNQYLTFTLGNEKYGIKIMNTREVLETTDITKVPRMPEFMCGIINLRGSVVPIIDLKKKFSMEYNSSTEKNNIIVTEMDNTDVSNNKLTIGIYTDSVHKVITIEPSDIEAAPQIGVQIDTDFIHGMGKVEDEFIILLKLDKIITSSDILIDKNNDEIKEE